MEHRPRRNGLARLRSVPLVLWLVPAVAALGLGLYTHDHRLVRAALLVLAPPVGWFLPALFLALGYQTIRYLWGPKTLRYPLFLAGELLGVWTLFKQPIWFCNLLSTTSPRPPALSVSLREITVRYYGQDGTCWVSLGTEWLLVVIVLLIGAPIIEAVVRRR